MGGGGKQTIGYRYYMGIHMGVCIGPVDNLIEIRVGDRTAWSGNVTANGVIDIDAPELFGGEKKEGGIKGALDVMMGGASQGANSYLTSVQGPVQPGYRGFLGVVWRAGLVACNNPYVKPWAFRVRRILAGWDGGTPWNSTKASLDFGNGVFAMNPAHIVYQCLTDRSRGKGFDVARLDLDSFETAADTFFDEGMALCFTWNKTSEIDEFIQQVCNHAGAAVGEDPSTGLIRMSAIRADYDVEDLAVFSRAEGNVIKVEGFDRAAATGTTNEITIQFVEQSTGKTGSVTVQHLGSVQSQKRSLPLTKTYSGCPTVPLATRIALRDLNVATAALARVRIRCTRDAYGILPGDVIAFSEPRRQVALMPVRVAKVDYGSLERGEIIIEGVQDVFGLPLTTYLAPQTGVWVPPDTTPEAPPFTEMIEAPYRDLVLQLGNSNVKDFEEETGFVASMASRPEAISINYQLHTRVGASAYELADDAEWCPTGVLAADIDKVEDSITLNFRVDLDVVEVGTVALIGGEHVGVTSVDADTGVIGISRGCLDTVPALHTAGDRVWFYEAFSGSDSTEYATGETVDGLFRTVTSSGILAEVDSPEDSVTMAQRLFRPYPPGNLLINGDAYPDAADGELVITWAHRDRLLQQDQIIDTLEGNIGPEDGVTYNVRIIDADTDTELDSDTGVTATTYSFTPSADATIRVEVEAERGGLVSWQFLNHEFDYTEEGGGGGSENVAMLLHFDEIGGPSTGTPVIDMALLDRVFSYSGTGQTIQNTIGKFDGALQRDSGTSAILSTTDRLPSLCGEPNWSIDFWFYRDSNFSSNGQAQAIFLYNEATTGPGVFSTQVRIVRVDAFTHRIEATWNGIDGNITLTAFPNFAEDFWTHIAVSRNGNELTLWVDGLGEATETIDDYTEAAGTKTLTIMSSSTTGFINMYVDEFRMVVGETVYTSDFAPEIAPYEDP